VNYSDIEVAIIRDRIWHSAQNKGVLAETEFNRDECWNYRTVN
jgi:hypothetical protein